MGLEQKSKQLSNNRFACYNSFMRQIKLGKNVDGTTQVEINISFKRDDNIPEIRQITDAVCEAYDEMINPLPEEVVVPVNGQSKFEVINESTNNLKVALFISFVSRPQ